MLLSSTYSSKPLLSTSLRVTKSTRFVPEEEDKTPSDYYTEEEKQIQRTRDQIEKALSDLKQFLDIEPEVPHSPLLAAQAGQAQMLASVSPDETHAILQMIDKQAQQIDQIEEKLKDSQNGSGTGVSQSQLQAICFPKNEQIVRFMQAFQDHNPALLVNYQDIVDFLTSRQCTDSLGLDPGAQDLRTVYFKQWTAEFESRVLSVLKIKFGDYKGDKRTGALALKQFAGDDGKMSVYQLWVCCIAFWWVCGGSDVRGKGLCVGGSVGFQM